MDGLALAPIRRGGGGGGAEARRTLARDWPPQRTRVTSRSAVPQPWQCRDVHAVIHFFMCA